MARRKRPGSTVLDRVQFVGGCILKKCDFRNWHALFVIVSPRSMGEKGIWSEDMLGHLRENVPHRNETRAAETTSTSRRGLQEWPTLEGISVSIARRYVQPL